VTNFEGLADNLRESFRVLAAVKPGGDVVELPGVSIASLSVSFQMFNAAFLSQPVDSQTELERRLAAAREFFHNRNTRWSFWICDDWLANGVRRNLSRSCENFGLRLSSDMPGLVAEAILPPTRRLPPLDVRLVQSNDTLQDFRALGSTCFHVPMAWFSEVFDIDVAARQQFICWVGYANGIPVTTAATVTSHGVIGVYNVATSPGHRQHGYAEAITRHAIGAALRETEAESVILQSTSMGLPLYERIGFQIVSRILVYNSVP
jgi:ribosomal protein S18 acetylase RimI-like enzyme